MESFDFKTWFGAEFIPLEACNYNDSLNIGT